jgi:hypothetical protein
VRVQAEHALQFIQERDRIAGGPVELVHEGDDRNSPEPADLKKLPGLVLDSLPGINDHDGGVHGSEHAVGVFGKILVARRVEQVHKKAAVLELQHGGTHRDAALTLQFHPVGGGRPLVFPGGDRSGKLQGPPVQQKLFRQRGFARVWMGDDGESAPLRNVLFHGRVRHQGGPGPRGRPVKAESTVGGARRPRDGLRFRPVRRLQDDV